MTYTLSHILKDERCVINIKEDTWRVFYPLDNIVDLEDVNEVLDHFDLAIKELVVDNFTVDDTTTELTIAS